MTSPAKALRLAAGSTREAVPNLPKPVPRAAECDALTSNLIALSPDNDPDLLSSALLTPLKYGFLNLVLPRSSETLNKPA